MGDAEIITEIRASEKRIIKACGKGGSPMDYDHPDVEIEEAPTYDDELERIYGDVDESCAEQGGRLCPVVNRVVLERASNVAYYGNSCKHNIGQRCNLGLPPYQIIRLNPKDCETYQEIFAE